MIAAALVLAALALAGANGANDNFKGVATLYGTGRLSYRRALALATATTLMGSLTAILLAEGLVRRFSGRGLVPDAVAGDPVFLLAVAIGAAATVGLATRLGLPISTTHALIGALLGAGLTFAGPSGVSYVALVSSFLLPLLLSPAAALVLAAGLRAAVSRAGDLFASEPVCLCVGTAPAVPVSAPNVGIMGAPSVRVAGISRCALEGHVVALAASPGRVADALHLASAGAVGFARGLNDAPKIAGLLVGVGALGLGTGTAALAAAMAAGGFMAARRVAGTLSFGITRMSAAEGLGANLLTAGLVVLASPLGLPVSTTHVSCGALFGIGAANGAARWKMIGAIVAAWGITLPVSGAVAALAAAALAVAR